MREITKNTTFEQFDDLLAEHVVRINIYGQCPEYSAVCWIGHLYGTAKATTVAGAVERALVDLRGKRS